jgi:hypothetical protein
MDEQSERAPELLFGGLGIGMVGCAPAQGIFGIPGEDGQPNWFRALEAAFFKLTDDAAMRETYGDPQKGATLAQAWRTNGLFGMPLPVCLMVPDQARVRGDEIDTLYEIPAPDLAQLVCRSLAVRKRSAAQLFVSDGQCGHVITALQADADMSGLTYHDPWPGDSLLSVGQNAAGVSARRAGEGWHITNRELEKVIVAAFIVPSVWALMCGEPGPPTFTDLRNSEFWQYFHISEESHDDSDRTHVHIRLRPGGWVEHIAMHLYCYEDDYISSAELSLRQSWVIGPPWGINPFAKDLARSWLLALTAASDQEAIRPLVDQLRSLTIDEELKTKTMDPQWCKSPAGQLTAAYLGLNDTEFHVALGMTAIFVDSLRADNDTWTRILVSL